MLRTIKLQLREEEGMKKFKMRSRSCGLSLRDEEEKFQLDENRSKNNENDSLMASAPLVLLSPCEKSGNKKRKIQQQSNKTREEEGERREMHFSGRAQQQKQIPLSQQFGGEALEEEEELILFPEITIEGYKFTISPHLSSPPSSHSKKELGVAIKKEFEEICTKLPFLTTSLSFRQKSEIFPSSCVCDNWNKNRYTDVLCTEETRVILKKNNQTAKFEDSTSNLNCNLFDESNYDHFDNLNCNLFDFSHTSLSISPDQNQQKQQHLHESFSRDSDYINANWVSCSDESSLFVATQAPLSSTICDFLEMTWQVNSRVIVCLSSLFEGGKKKMDEYWPSIANQTLSFHNFSLTLKKTETQKGFIIRQLLLKNLSTEESRDLFHYHYSEWPDYGVPESPNQICSLIKIIFSTIEREKAVKQQEDTNNGPMIVHCSAGIGRSATFIGIYSAIEIISSLRKKYGKKIPRNLLNKKIDLFSFVSRMRKMRSGMIQTWKQYSFCYKAINFFLSQ